MKVEEEDQAIILLALLLSSFENLMTTLLVGKTTLTIDEVSSVLLGAEKIKNPSNTSQVEDSC